MSDILSQSDLAELLGYHPQQKARIRKKLEDQGVKVFIGKTGQVFTFIRCFTDDREQGNVVTPIEFVDDGPTTKDIRR